MIQQLKCVSSILSKELLYNYFPNYNYQPLTWLRVGRQTSNILSKKLCQNILGGGKLFDCQHIAISSIHEFHSILFQAIIFLKHTWNLLYTFFRKFLKLSKKQHGPSILHMHETHIRLGTEEKGMYATAL